jgi:hypothetical protein
MRTPSFCPWKLHWDRTSDNNGDGTVNKGDIGIACDNFTGKVGILVTQVFIVSGWVSLVGK